eukprot:m51a1_g9372 putative transaldolase (320) ;mRNA; f:196238-197477
MANALEELRKYTTVVADSGEFESFAAYHPTDATTNPTLILQAASATSNPNYRSIVASKAAAGSAQQRTTAALARVAVEWGIEILKNVPGRVSTEVDARLSFDTHASIAKAREAVALYEAAGIPRSRVLVKIAATWEGVEACRVLEKEGIHCNMTLIFSAVQAMACSDAGATLISPFVGRITDYFAAKEGRKGPYEAAADPGVLSVARIFAAFKARHSKTQVMGASFRTKEQVSALAGCDLLTISPKLLGELQNAPADFIRRRLGAETPADVPQWEELTQSRFRFLMNQDEMATIKLAEGIRRFCADIDELEKRLASLIQ